MKRWTGRKWLVMIMVISVIARLGVASIMANAVDTLPGIADQVSYHTLATRLLGGYGFTFDQTWWPITPAGQPTAHWSYLYTGYLVLVYVIFGIHPLAARVIQAVLAGILLPWLVYRVTKRVFKEEPRISRIDTEEDKGKKEPQISQIDTEGEKGKKEPRISRIFIDKFFSSGEMTALLAAGWAAIYGYFVYYGAALMTESFYMVGILWILDLGLQVAEKFKANPPSKIPNQKFLLLGLVIALTAMLRQVFLPFVPVLFLWLWWVRAGQEPAWRALFSVVKKGLVTLAVIVVLIAPITFWNYHQFGRFVLLNTNAGYAFFWANHPIHGYKYIPLLTPPKTPSYQDLIPVELRSMNEAALDQELLKRGIGFVLSNPLRYLSLCLTRIPDHFIFWPTQDSTLMSNLTRLESFTLALPFMLTGILIWLLKYYRKIGKKLDWFGLLSDEAMLLVLFMSIYVTIHLLSWTGTRYRLPTDAVALVFAPSGLLWWMNRLRIPAFIKNQGKPKEMP